MSESTTGKSFTSVQDRLKMFEQQNLNPRNVVANSVRTEFMNSNNKSKPATVSMPVKSVSLSKGALNVTATTKSNVTKQIQPPNSTLSTVKSSIKIGSEKPLPPVRNIVSKEPPPIAFPPPPLLATLAQDQLTTSSTNVTRFPRPPQTFCLANNSNAATDVKPPSLPPLPTNLTKTPNNFLIGWAKTPDGKTCTTAEKKNQNKDNVAIEKNPIPVTVDEPPPILAPPPTLETLKKVVKIQKKEKVTTLPEEDTYDEDIPVENDFVNCPWYFDIQKTEASKMMQTALDVGTFIVRPSDDDQFVLMVRAQEDLVKKFKIQHLTSGWILGDPTKCKKIYPSMISLMDFYLENGVRVGNITLKLKGPVHRQ